MLRVLNDDSLNYLISYLDPVSMMNLSLTSNFFLSRNENNKYWLKRISKDFHFPEDYLLLQFDTLMENSIKLIDVYRYLHTLKKNQNHLPNHLKFSYEDENNYRFIFACCTNNVKYFSSIVPYEEHRIWAEISLYAGCDKLIIFSLNCYIILNSSLDEKEEVSTLQKIFLDSAMRAGRKDVIKHFLEQENFIAKPDTHSLRSAACSGNIPLFTYLVDPCSKFDLDINHISEEFQICLDKTAFYGHLDLFKLIYSMGVKITPTTLVSAICSRQFQLVEFIVNQNLKSEKNDIASIIQDGFKRVNLSIYRDLLLDFNLSDEEIEKEETNIMIHFLTHSTEYQTRFFDVNKEDFQNDAEILNHYLGISGNLPILKQFLSEDEKGNFKANQLCLKNAIRHGHFEMCKYLIQDLNVIPDQNIIAIAMTHSTNSSLVKFLLERRTFSFIIETGWIGKFSGPAIANYARSTLYIEYTVARCHFDQTEDEIMHYLPDDEAKKLLFISFTAAPLYHLGYVSYLLECDTFKNDAANERNIQLLQDHLNYLDNLNLKKYFPQEYSERYSVEIKNIIHSINKNISEKQEILKI